MARKFSSVLAIIFFLISFEVHAYPELARQGYLSCNTCHVSLNGGGLLNDYGRQISNEVLAIWKSQNEETPEPLFAYGVMKNSPIQEWLKLGGDYRSIYFYQNNAAMTSGKTIFMQADLEAAAILGKWTILASSGLNPNPGQNVNLFSRRHFVQYSLTDEWNIRAGRFTPAFGINSADHTSVTRNPLSFGQRYESYNLELSYLSNTWDWFVTGVVGRPDDKVLHRDQAVAMQGAFHFNEKMKAGTQFWYGKNDKPNHRWLFGAFGILGLTESLMLQSEINHQWFNAMSSHQQGLVLADKISYEVLTGWWLVGTQEYSKTNSNSPMTETEVYGLGMQLFPRSHFEFLLSFQKVRQRGQGAYFSDQAWMMAHFYL